MTEQHEAQTRRPYGAGMTQDQEDHLLGIQLQFARLVDYKYRKGQKEHGGDLFAVRPMVLIDEAICEAIDGIVYLFTLRQVFLKQLEAQGHPPGVTQGEAKPLDDAKTSSA